jgi:L-fuconolactonase
MFAVMIRVDAHHHLWRLDRGDADWIAPDPALHRDYELGDLRPLVDNKIDATVLVQTSPSEAETAWLLETAHASNGLVRGVVGWTDLSAPGAAERIHGLAKDPLLKGLRPMPRDIEDTYWVLRDEVKPALRAMAETGLCFDAVIEPRHLALLPVLQNFVPGLKVVIQQDAKPSLGENPEQSWSRDLSWSGDLARVAKETGYFCKLSGVAAMLGPNTMMNDVRPWVDRILDSFGPTRVMWGSGWPVAELACGYARWHTMTERFLFRYNLPKRAEVMGGTAARFYGLAL